MNFVPLVSPLPVVTAAATETFSQMVTRAASIDPMARNAGGPRRVWNLRSSRGLLRVEIPNTSG